MLSREALQSGRVQSTTRYRKTASNKKSIHNYVPAIQRQQSGAKGGQAARKAAIRKARAKTVPRNVHALTPLATKFPELGFVTSCYPTVEVVYQSVEEQRDLSHGQYLTPPYDASHLEPMSYPQTYSECGGDQTSFRDVQDHNLPMFTMSNPEFGNQG